jgi:hypothetical protein
VKSKIMNAVALLDAVTVPPGQQPATDSGQGEGPGDHTVYAVVYERGVPGASGPTMYWRSVSDQSLQRLVLTDLALDVAQNSTSDEVLFLHVSNDLPWFVDAAAAFQP